MPSPTPAAAHGEEHFPAGGGPPGPIRGRLDEGGRLAGGEAALQLDGGSSPGSAEADVGDRDGAEAERPVGPVTDRRRARPGAGRSGLDPTRRTAGTRARSLPGPRREGVPRRRADDRRGAVPAPAG